MSAEHWESLHTFSLDPWNPEQARLWYKNVWKPAIPDYGNCECKKHWEQVEAVLDPQMGSEKTFQLWSWQAHNAVNERLGKPFFSLDDFFEKYHIERFEMKTTDSKCQHLGEHLGYTGTPNKKLPVHHCSLLEVPCTARPRKPHENKLRQTAGGISIIGRSTPACSTCPEFAPKETEIQ